MNDKDYPQNFETGPFTFEPVGFVENSFLKPTDPDNFINTVSDIRLKDRYREGLFKLDEFKRAYVIYVFDRAETGHSLLVHPRGDVTRPMRGVFATRSPRRPNPIGLCVCEIITVQGPVLTVRNLDALNGTPVLDIKFIRDNDLY
jgi:tRNA (adenine37-N6)-methyltransferase